MASIDTADEPVVAAVAGLVAQGPDYRGILDHLPTAVYTTDAEGIVTYFNPAAAELAGRRPRIGVDRWCVTHRLYHPDGRPLPHGDCPMAVAVRERRPVRGIELIVERPNGERAPTLPFPTPLFDAQGHFAGAINLLVDISRLKSAEQQVARHAGEQAALYRFTDRLYRADTLEAIYDAALDAIVESMGCERASILLFDAQGTMRFVAGRGLSEGYMLAVDGHSPWRPTDRDPAPIFVTDIMESDEPEALKRTIRAEGITALAFIPLTADGLVIGKFMTYYRDAHLFAPAERDLAVTIARQLGFAIASRRAEEARQAAERELRESHERLRLATEAGKVGLWDWDIPGDRIVWTESLYAMHGLDREAFTQTFADWIGRVHADDRPTVLRAIERALRDEAPYEIELRTVRPDGGETCVYTNAVVVREGARPVRLVGATVDITERKQAERQRDLMVAELSHRVKNTLATVVSIARQSFGPEATIESARHSFEGRVRALAQTHTRLAEANWEGVPFTMLVEDELAPYRTEDASNIVLDGPALALSPKQAVTLGMGLHELATNAAKYGALSAKGGVVTVSWRVLPEDRSFVLDWREAGGPPVTAPERSGFGRLLLERALAADLRGAVAMDFRAEGLNCRITVPLEPPGVARGAP